MDSKSNSDPKGKTMKTNKQITVKKIANCSSDHLPIIATIPIPKSKLTYKGI